MEAFYALATEDYRQLVIAADWEQLLRARAREGWRLLDVACGSGKFPAALLRHADLTGLPEVDYDLLDPSAFSIAEARAQLRHPLRAGRELAVTLQELPADAGTYDVVWATHALYALPPAELPHAAQVLRRAVRPGVVAHATRASHYLAFDDAYRAGVRQRTPYLSAEQVQEALAAAGAQVREQRITYATGTADRSLTQGFLQRCAFDDALDLEQMESAPVLGDYLAGCRTADGSYSFQHEVTLLWF